MDFEFDRYFGWLLTARVFFQGRGQPTGQIPLSGLPLLTGRNTQLLLNGLAAFSGLEQQQGYSPLTSITRIKLF